MRRFGLMCLVTLALSGHTLDWPMVYDDLHLIRRLETRELLSAWVGSWDPDGVETPGYRPLSTLFNHARGVAFGESMRAHRLFAALLLAGYAVLLARLAERLGLSAPLASAGAVLFLFSRSTVFHHVWLTNSNHMVQGLAFLGAAFLLIDGLARDSSPRLVASAALLMVAMLVREDSLAAFPAVVLVGAASLGPGHGAPRRLLGYTAGIGVVAVGLFVWRGIVLPQAPAPGFDLGGYLRALLRAFVPGGLDAFDGVISFLRLAWVGLLLVGLLAFVVARIAPGRATLLWLAATLFAATPGLTIPREDLFFFACSFASLFLASACGDLARAGGLLRFAPLALVVAMLGGGYAARALSENFHPASTKALWWNARMVYGPLRAKAKIPEVRRRDAASRLASVGIRRMGAARVVLRRLRAQAEAENRRRPSGNRPFLPILQIQEF